MQVPKRNPFACRQQMHDQRSSGREKSETVVGRPAGRGKQGCVFLGDMRVSEFKIK
jgi:hypothetical protein